METTCKFSVKKVSESYVGSVRWYEGDRYLWSETSKINRLTEDDALMDAYHMAQATARENGGCLAL